MKTLSNHRITTFAFIFVTLFVAVFLTSCSPKTDTRQESDNSATAKPANEPTGDELYIDNNIAVQKPLARGNFVVFPLTAKKMKSIGDFMTLDEAAETKSVVVSEIGENAAQVDTLTVENKSDKPLFLLSGEICYGGKQNRIIRHSMVISPGQKMEVPVRCIEQGRWSGGHSDFMALKKANAPAGVRQAAQQKSQSQQSTWQEVEKNLKSFSKDSSTRSLTEAVADPEIQNESKKYFEDTLTALTGNERVVGIVIAVNGRIIGSDVFSSHELFKRYAEKLLNSYALEALIRKTEKTAGTETTMAQVCDYLLRTKDGKKEDVIDNGPYKVSRVVNGNQNTLRLEMENVGELHENSFETNSSDDQDTAHPPSDGYQRQNGPDDPYYPEEDTQQQQNQSSSPLC